VVVTRGNDSVVGLAERIDDDGRLVVRPPGGPVEIIAAGDVTHVRPERGTWAGDTD
jgi:BirA family biotin operon repressor/biotin-[acetyl-CoA-carboxylase] ligase